MSLAKQYVREVVDTYTRAWEADWSASGQTMHCFGSTLETIAPLF